MILVFLLVNVVLISLISDVQSLDMGQFTDASSLPLDQQEYINAEYEKFMKQRLKDKL